MPRESRRTIHEVAEASTTEPRTGECQSPMISSSANRTAAIGVLNAAEIAAAAPTGNKARTFSALRPSLRPRTDAIPAPTATDGPSGPSGMPEASVTDVQRNLPMILWSVIHPSRKWRGLRLDNAIGTRIWKEPRQNIADTKRSHDGAKKFAPS